MDVLLIRGLYEEAGSLLPLEGIIVSMLLIVIDVSSKLFD